MPVELPPTGALVAGATGAHRRLSTTIEGLTDDTARRPSLLPDWTAGHVLTHIARNADSHIGMLEGALAGEQRHQYPGGHEQRAAEIAAGSDRPAAELVADVRSTADRLQAVWTRMTVEAWDGGGLFNDGSPWPAPLIVLHRWREVEIHHADLGLGYGPEDWPEEYIATELPRQLSVLPDRLDGDQRRHLMAWLFGREPQPSLEPLVTDGRMFQV